MITIQAKKHDNFSVEFKFGFVGGDDAPSHEFVVNSWIFVPNSLDINPQTYGKKQFYRDIKSNVRLITPVYSLADLANMDALPFRNLRSACEVVAERATISAVANYESQIKMFAAIFKSAMRNHSIRIADSADVEEVATMSEELARCAKQIVGEYRNIYRLVNVPRVEPKLRGYYLFGDEILTHFIDLQAFRVLKKIDKLLTANPQLATVREQIVELMREEKEYKCSMGYDLVSTDNPKGNRQLVFRYGMLKKYVESDLYIRLNKKRDGFAVEQVYYSIAAGLAMIFATAVAWFAQLKYGNITGPLFIVLVVSYMLKDRIKDLMRYYFAHRLGNKFFDNKAQIKIQDRVVGEIKEGVDFISDSQTPREVLDVRSRSSLVEAENRIFEEKILLYRKRVVLDSGSLNSDSMYYLNGINEILRFHTHRFTQKMDNPEVPVNTLDEEGRVQTVRVQKIYYLNLVMQLCEGKDTSYKRFRIVMTRNGILAIEEM